MASITHSGVLPDSAQKTDFYAIIDNGTVGSIVNADIAAGAAIADTKLATISTAGKVNLTALVATNQASGDIVYASGSTSFARLAAGADGTYLKMVSGVPAWGSTIGAMKGISYVMYGSVATGNTAIPNDNSIPTTAEGNQFMTLSHTPSASSNKLKIDVVANFSCAGTKPYTIVLFQDDVAIAATQDHADTLDKQYPSFFSYYGSAGTSAASTFAVRAGSSDGDALTFNGVSSSGKMGGIMASSLSIIEIVA